MEYLDTTGKLMASGLGGGQLSGHIGWLVVMYSVVVPNRVKHVDEGYVPAISNALGFPSSLSIGSMCCDE
jgi:hypothetical protein